MGDAAFVSKWIAHLWLIFCNKVYAICMAQSHMQNLFRIMILSSIGVGLINSWLATLAVNLFELAYSVPACEFKLGINPIWLVLHVIRPINLVFVLRLIFGSISVKDQWQGNSFFIVMTRHLSFFVSWTSLYTNVLVLFFSYTSKMYRT